MDVGALAAQLQAIIAALAEHSALPSGQRDAYLARFSQCVLSPARVKRPAAAAGATPRHPSPLSNSTEEYRQAKIHFDAADADRSGSVTVVEMQRYLLMGCQRPVPLHYARMIVRCFDTSGDGALDFAEFFTLHSMIQQCVFCAQRQPAPP